jgi:Rad9
VVKVYHLNYITFLGLINAGVVKSYKLTYEPVSVQHALFDQSRVRNQWKIEAKILREVIDHFSPSSEQLDIYPDTGKAIFTSFTNKISDGKGIYTPLPSSPFNSMSDIL